jgi:hypothetical protein
MNFFSGWSSQKETAAYFGLSERTLARRRYDNLLPPGICWIRKFPNNANSCILYDIDACEQAFRNATFS